MRKKTPGEWNKSICSLFKKGDKTDCKNYRGFTLLPHSKNKREDPKRRLREMFELKLDEWGCEFRPNRSTIDLIFALRMVCKKTGSLIKTPLLI